jgi:VWFA-related protein
MRRSLATFALAAGLTIVVAGQQAPPQFRASVDLVYVDVSVFDANRRPVRGLSASDFLVREDGDPQEIGTFAAVDFPDAPTFATSWIREVAPDIHRNDTLDDRRLFVLVMDDATAQSNLAALRAARETATEFIDRMGPSDLAAVVFTQDVRKSQDYTGDKARLRRTVQSFNSGGRDMGRLPGGPDTDVMAYLGSVETIEAVAESLSALPQRRKTLVYIGQGVPMDPEQASEAVLIGPDQLNAVSAAATQRDLVDRFNRALRAAQRSNVNVYAMDICGMRVPPAAAPATPGDTVPNPAPTCVPGLEQRYLRSLAESTGGRAALDSNDLTEAVEQVFIENASYYVLGVRSTNPRREGKFRRLDVRIPGRPDLTVRARSGYNEVSPSREAKDAAAAARAPLTKAISGLLPSSDLPLQAWAGVFPVAGRKEARVTVSLGVRHEFAAREVSRTETIDLTVNAFLQDGRARGSRQLTSSLTLRPGPVSEVGFEIPAHLDLPPGRYQLRIGVFVRSSRATGSVFVDVDVPDFRKTPASLSTLAVHVAPAVPQAATGEAAVVPETLTSERVFDSDDTAVVLAQMYRHKGEGAVRWTADVLHDSGRNLSRVSGTVEPSAFLNGIAPLRLVLPTASLPRGGYLLRVTLPGTDTSSDVTVRDLRFWIR